nr:MAG TPA: ESX-1 secretion-associated regulator [Caudoviricetes sp.]
MDITLERMLTLIPKKENGNFKHGALSQFARSIGFKDGHIVSDWIAGNSESYKNYIYQVSALYHVSVEWLQGKTEDKSIKETPDPKIEGVSPTVQELFDFIDTATDAELNELLRYAQFLMSKR